MGIAYRFCRTDDVPLLVEALRRCWVPHIRDTPEPTTASFKQEIRELQVWCGSCMLALDGDEPVGVLIGAKRRHETLVHRLAVHPSHCRRGHGRHLVTSLLSKLAILGPPRLVAEVSTELSAMRGLLRACGFVEEAILTDYVLEADVTASTAGRGRTVEEPWNAVAKARPSAAALAIPLTVRDIEANGLFADQPRTCWERGPETVRSRREEHRGLALVREDRIEAWALWRPATDGEPARQAHEEERDNSRPERGVGTQLVALRATDASSNPLPLLAALLERLRSACAEPISIRRTHPQELSPSWLGALGFRPRSRVGLYARIALDDLPGTV